MRIATASILFACGFLSACGDKPPGCGEPETLTLAKQMVAENFQQSVAEEVRNAPADAQAKVRALAGQYVATLNIELLNIVSNGYNSEAKKNSCEGKVVVKSPSNTLSVETKFTTQMTVDGKGQYLLSIETFKPLIAGLMQDFVPFLVAKQQEEAQKSVPSSLATAAPAQATKSRKLKKDDGEITISIGSDSMKFAMTSSVDTHRSLS